MFLAPPLAPEVKRRGRIFRFLSGLGLVSAVLLLFACSLVLHVRNYYLVDMSATPVELYHNTWKAVKDNLYDQNKLKDWDKWEHKYDGDIHSQDDAIMYTREMVASLGDPYTALLDPPQVKSSYQQANGKFIGIGVIFEPKLDVTGRPVINGDGLQVPAVNADGMPVIKSALRGSPAYQAGIASGDALVSIDGRLTAGKTVEELAAEIKGNAGTQVILVVRQNGVAVTLTLTRGEISIPIVSTARLPGNVGYLRVEAFDQLDTDEQIKNALLDLQDTKALIIDLRGNPGGFIHSSILAASYFLDQGTITSERMRIPGGGYLTYTASVSGQWLKISAAGVPLLWRTTGNLTGNKPVVVLVNENTASAAELFTAALQDNGRAIVLGTETFGKGIGQTYVPVGNGARVRITNIHGLTPNGRWLGDGRVNVAAGCRPDIPLEPAANLEYASRNDNQLRAALEYLRAKHP